MAYIYNPVADIDFQKWDSSAKYEVLDTDTGQKIDLLATIKRIQQVLNNKVDIAQGIVNKNKILVVNTEGNVVPTAGVVMTQAERTKLQKIDINYLITPAEREKLKRLTDVIILKGVLDDYDKLIQITTKEVGDCYYVTSTKGDKIIYAQYVWTGDRWSVVGTYDNAPEYIAADCISIINGVINVLYDNVTIKRNPENNELYVPVDGEITEYSDNPASSSAVYKALQKAILSAGDHITISADGNVKAHSFVPQYDDVSKVLPHEMQFQYTGDTTEDGKWVKDFFYRKKLVSKPVTDITTYQLPANTRYIEILKDGYGAPVGRYYLIEDYKYVDELKAKYSEIDFFVTQYSKKQLGSDGVRYNSSCPDILKIGDYVWDYDNRYDRHKIVATTGTFNDTFILDNGASITYRGAGGSGNDIEAYVNSDGVMIFYSMAMSLVATELREYYGKLYSYNEGLVVYGENEQYYTAYTKEPISHTITYTYGQDVYDWQQVNVQPQGIPAELEDKIHDQNTDTQLKDGAVKVTDTDVSINKPLMAGRYGQNDGTKALVIGNGTSDTDNSNATTIDLNGNIQTIGDVATPTHSLNNTLQGKVCTFEEMMAHYTAGNGMTYMIIE